jgi:hypothetical protein
MNYSDFLFKMFFIFMFIKYIVKNTCVFNNHDFTIMNKKVICQKCGLIKETIRNG